MKLVNNYLDPQGVFIFDLNTVHKYRDLIGDRTIAEAKLRQVSNNAISIHPFLSIIIFLTTDYKSLLVYNKSIHFAMKFLQAFY